jgi:predicted O-methyltransferase YrrM
VGRCLTDMRVKSALRRSVLARILLLPRRYRTARAVGTWSRRQVLEWLAASREYTNFTYELTPSSESELNSFVSRVLGVEPSLVSEVIAELRGDDELTRHIAAATRLGPYRHVADPVALYGRRAGWYAFTRITKPRLVVESGVEKGLGACVLASALLRNAQEGSHGRYLGFDVDASAGRLVSGPYADVATVQFGDSLTLLSELEGPIDLFIHDSDHAPWYERAEYAAASPKLSSGAVVLSDNAHATEELRAFAAASGRRYHFWHEEPERHWYPGGGIGVAWVDGAGAIRKRRA